MDSQQIGSRRGFGWEPPHLQVPDCALKDIPPDASKSTTAPTLHFGFGKDIGNQKGIGNIYCCQFLDRRVFLVCAAKLSFRRSWGCLYATRRQGRTKCKYKVMSRHSG